MTTLQWVVVALGCMIAGMAISRLVKSRARPPATKRKNDD
jgi:hypothetical protein